MIPANFEGSNGVADTPPGVDPDKIQPLYVYRDGAAILSCWRPTAEEMEEIKRTGRIWLWVLGSKMMPVALTGISPWPGQGATDGN